LILAPTPLQDVVLVNLERHSDERGFFARSWCALEFEAAGLPGTFVQSSIAWNERRHTLRGMHWEAPPQRESKLIRCTRGAVFDVVVDLRPESPTYLDHVGIELDADNRRALFVPPGLAHGYLTLLDETEVLYQMDSPYVPEAERGARWDDPSLGIDWPAAPIVISVRDRSFPAFRDQVQRAGDHR
jgi:dTDP-4-dehydrorhamnose 3,5-epimerase